MATSVAGICFTSRNPLRVGAPVTPGAVFAAAIERVPRDIADSDPHVVLLCGYGNPDMGQYGFVCEPMIRVVTGVQEARSVVENFRDETSLGAGNWGGLSGLVVSSATCSRTCYNGRHGGGVSRTSVLRPADLMESGLASVVVAKKSAEDLMSAAILQLDEIDHNDMCDDSYRLVCDAKAALHRAHVVYKKRGRKK